MSDTFFTEPPDWTWFIIPYFYVGGIAGGALFLGALLHLFGKPVDRPIVRLAYKIAFFGAIISGLLLILDLGKPLRFWHMLFASETGRPLMKLWSPMSVGAWGLVGFGLFATLAALGAWHEEGRIRGRWAGAFSYGPLAALIAILGATFGFFLAGYTGVLLAVTNRPIWADSNWLGALFLVSGASTAAALLILLARRRRLATDSTLAWLGRVDGVALVLELVAIVIFLVSLGSVARVFLGWWGVVLVLGVIGAGILAPLAIGAGRVARVRDRAVTAAALVLIGGFLLRVTVLLASEGVRVAGHQVVGQ